MDSTVTPQPSWGDGRHRRSPQVDLAPAVLDRLSAARYIGIGRAKLDYLVAEGGIPSLLIGTRRLFRIVDLDAWIEARVVSGADG